MLKSEIKLGQKVKDTVTGFTGIVIAKAEYLNGCISLDIKPEKLSKDGETIASEWIDYEQLEVLSAGVTKKRKSTSSGGRCYQKSI